MGLPQLCSRDWSRAGFDLIAAFSGDTVDDMYSFGFYLCAYKLQILESVFVIEDLGRHCFEEKM